MNTNKANYYGGLKEASKSNKTLGTSSIFGVISSILTGGKSANITATADTEYREVDVSMPYGFASFGGKGMKAHVLTTGKKSTVVGIVDPKRPSTKRGEVIIYTEDGTMVKFDNDGNINIRSDKNVTIDATNVTINGNLNVSGSISAPNGTWHRHS